MQLLIKNILYLILLLTIQWSNAALPIQKVPLDSGATLYFVEARTIPMVNIGLNLNAGSVFDPKGKSSVADMTANMLNKGAMIQGVKRDEAYISDKIADLGARFGANVSAEKTSFQIRTLSKKELLNEVITQVSDLIAHPSFDPKILAREKSLAISGLLESQTKPEYILQEEFNKKLFQSNPLGTSTTVADIKAINVEDLKKFHQTYYRAKNTNVIIVGDTSLDEAIQIGNRLTNQLVKAGEVDLNISPLKPLQKLPLEAREVRIPHPSQQAHIQIGIDSPPRNHPDYYALLVGNYILGGGGFVSRLMNEVREKRGLAYSVSSYFYPAKNFGYFVAGMQTKKEQSDQSVKLVRQTIDEFVKNGPSDDEIKAAKSNLINGFPLRIDSNGKLLDNIANIAWNDLPLNTLDIWPNEVQKVSKEDIQRVFKKYLDEDRMITVIVGGQ